ncbi:MAG: signal peptidase II [Candidatus Zixiibacteriota bacterium]
MSWLDNLRWSPANRYLANLSLISALILLSDQITKILALKNLSPVTKTNVIGDLVQFTLVFNEGGAFSTKLGSTYFYAFASVVVMIIVFVVLYKDSGKNRVLDLALALVLGGALGNFTDRLRFGAVVDWIDVDFPDFSLRPAKILFFDFPGYALNRWPVFNIADSAVTVGMVLIVFALILDSRKRKCDLNHSQNSSPA